MQEIKTVVLPLTEVTVKKKKLFSVETGEMLVKPIEDTINEYLKQGWEFVSMEVVSGMVKRKVGPMKKIFSKNNITYNEEKFNLLVFKREVADAEIIEEAEDTPKKKHHKDKHEKKEDVKVVEDTLVEEPVVVEDVKVEEVPVEQPVVAPIVEEKVEAPKEEKVEEKAAEPVVEEPKEEEKPKKVVKKVVKATKKDKEVVEDNKVEEQNTPSSEDVIPEASKSDFDVSEPVLPVKE